MSVSETKEITVVPVVLCGGSGTRLWPLSRPELPKPFLPLFGAKSLFERTLARLDGAGMTSPIIVAGPAHRSLIEEQAVRGAQLIVEPCARNTAAAIALAAHRAPADAVLLVCPSDHHIADRAAFDAAVEKAAMLAADGYLVALGIAPDRPETGFGYIRRGSALGDAGYEIAEFVEKPDLARAEAMLARGEYAWNGGIFAFRADVFLAELAAHRPELAELVESAVAQGRSDEGVFHPAAAPFSHIKAESVDYAVMEHTARAAVVEAAMGWSDIGSWQSLYAALAQDVDGKVVRGNADLVDCRGVLVNSDGPRVSAIGIEDIAIVVNGDEVLVTRLDNAQRVGQLPGAAGR